MPAGAQAAQGETAPVPATRAGGEEEAGQEPGTAPPTMKRARHAGDEKEEEEVEEEEEQAPGPQGGEGQDGQEGKEKGTAAEGAAEGGEAAAVGSAGAGASRKEGMRILGEGKIQFLYRQGAGVCGGGSVASEEGAHLQQQAGRPLSAAVLLPLSAHPCLPAYLPP